MVNYCTGWNTRHNSCPDFQDFLEESTDLRKSSSCDSSSWRRSNTLDILSWFMINYVSVWVCCQRLLVCDSQCSSVWWSVFQCKHSSDVVRCLPASSQSAVRPHWLSKLTFYRKWLKLNGNTTLSITCTDFNIKSHERKTQTQICRLMWVTDKNTTTVCYFRRQKAKDDRRD